MMQIEKAAPSGREVSSPFTSNAAMIQAAAETSNGTMLHLAEVHWEASDEQRRLMYLHAAQLDRQLAKEWSALEFEGFDVSVQVMLLGAIALRCPEMFRALVGAGYL